MNKEEILNWRYEELKYIEDEKLKFMEEASPFYHIFHSEKKQKEDLAKVETRAKLDYREHKLDTILDGVKQDRQRVDEQVLYANRELQKILSDIKLSLPDIHFETKVQDNYDLSIPNYCLMETKTIELKPYKIRFIQPKLGE